jgi:hypothetical protein
MNFAELPLEVLERVVNQCDVQEILNCRKVCKSLNTAVDHSKALKILLRVEGRGVYKASQEELRFEDAQASEELESMLDVEHNHDRQSIWKARDVYYSNRWPEFGDDEIARCRENGLGYLLRNVERLELTLSGSDTQTAVTVLGLLTYLGTLEPRERRFKELEFMVPPDYADCYLLLAQLDNLEIRFDTKVTILLPPFYSGYLRPAPLGRNVNRLTIFCHAPMVLQDQNGSPQIHLSDHFKFLPDLRHGELTVRAPGLEMTLEDLHNLKGNSFIGKLHVDGIAIFGAIQGTQVFPSVQWLELCDTNWNVPSRKDVQYTCTDTTRLSAILVTENDLKLFDKVSFPHVTRLSIEITEPFHDTDESVAKVIGSCPNATHLTIKGNCIGVNCHNFLRVSPSTFVDSKISAVELMLTDIPSVSQLAATLSSIPKLKSLKLETIKQVPDISENLDSVRCNTICESLIKALQLDNFEIRSDIAKSATIPGRRIPNGHHPMSKWLNFYTIVDLNAYKNPSPNN